MSTEIKKEKEPVFRRMKPSEMNSKPGKEQVDRRTRGSKVFCLGENAYQAVIYPESVHYQDKKTGKWQEIDNTLIERENKQNGRYLSNKQNGDLKVELFDAREKQMVRLTADDKHSISWYLEEAADVFPEIESRETPTPEKDDPRRKALDKLESAAMYKDILPGIDLRCILRGSAFKDELIFCEKETLRPITMNLSVPGLKAEQTENGELLFRDERGDAVFDLPPAFMRDAKDDLGEVQIKVEQTADSAWRVTYVPDMEWANKASYPIVLDPAVVTKNLATAIEDNYVASKKPNYTYPYNNTNLPICIGNSTYGTAYSYLRFLQSNLPTISSSYYVTKAYLYMGLKSAPSGNNLVYVKEVLSDWSSHSITYNQQPTIADKPFEYHYYTPSSTVNAYGAYDISNLVRKWYTGSNYGIRFELTGNGGLSLHSSDALYHRPYIVINYVSLAGVQGGLSYESQSVGRAGTGQVSLYNGNLIFTHQDTSMNGNRMPVSVAHVYNSCYYKKDAFGTGLGWTLSAQQYLHKEVLENNSGTYYAYTDETGARHYFRQIDGKWKDMSGLSLTLTISGNTATITDKSDTRMIFDVPTVDFNDDDNSSSVSAYANIKPLKQIIDACGNTATFTTNSSRRLTSIMDGARTNNVGRETQLTLNGSNLASIKEPGAPAVNYTYINGYLREIAYNDLGSTLPVNQRTAYYNYYESVNGVTDPREGLLKSVTNIDGLKVTYDYTETSPHRVIRMEISNGGTVYGGRKYEYKDCLTVVTDLVPDNNNELVEGKKLFYHFNDNGNVVSVNDELGYGCFAQYSDELPTNHPKTLSRLQRSVVNLLRDHGFESISNWTSMSQDGATGTYTQDTSEAYLGNKSLKLLHTNTDGELTEIQNVEITKGKTYTLSAYYKTALDAKAQLRVTYRDENGAEVHVDSQKEQSVNAWERMSVTFTVPENSLYSIVTVRLMAVDANGTVWFDCAQLEEGAIPNPYNMLLNGDFTFNVDGKPEAWLENSSNTADCKVYGTSTGSKPQGLSPNTMRIYGRGRKYYPGIYQDIPQSGNKDDVYRAGGWSFSYSKPRNGMDKLYCIRVAFLKTGTSSTRENSPSIEWSEEWTDWQFASGPVIAPCDYKAIRFNVDYERNFNYAEFGGFFLHKEEFGQTYDYDDDDNIKSVKNLAGEKSDAKYDNFNNLTEYIQPGRESADKYTLTWGDTDVEKKKHLLRTTTSPLGIVQANDYDGFGNPTESLTRDSTSEKVICGTTEYTSNGNYVASQTDARGNTVLSAYDLTKGTLNSVTNPNGQVTSYTYDDAKRVTETHSTTDGKTYRSQNTYADDKLVKVAHNTDSDTGVSVEYNFAYDDLGRQTTVAVGSQNLSTTHYNNDGTVSEIIYGNNETSLSPAAQSVRYSYDEFKRLKGVQFDDDTDDVYKYDYAANGQVGRLTDISLNRTYTSEYDTADRPMRMIQKQNGEHLYTGQVEYDKYNNLKTFKEKVGPSETSVAYRTDFYYDRENKPTLLTYGDEDHFVGYEYDSIGRMLTRTVKLGGSGQEQESSYEYVAGNNGSGNTTSLISKITHPHAEYEYTYDNMGNIVAWKQSAQTIVSYVYDHMGQLIRVNDPTDTTSGTTGTTWTYEYDRGGNILCKKRYAYATGTLGTVLETITYNYDSTWKDKLISLSDGSITQNINYDDIGNPLSDGTWNYTWEKGRQLKQMSNADKTITFDYNHDGLRVRKTVDDTNDGIIVTDYTLHGKNIVHMTRKNNSLTIDDSLHFFYDASNKPAIVDFNGTKYSYVQDLQGDICQIVDASGNVVVEYTYDAWGKVLSTTGSLASTLGTVQPFRYRGYVYDVETGLYYLRSRYYNPIWLRFINADNYFYVKRHFFSHNHFSYCKNSPVCYHDPSGHSWGLAILLVVVVTTLTGCSAQSPRSDLAQAPDLDINTAPASSYNCFGNAIGKQIDTDPPGYEPGESTRTTFNRVENAIGKTNIRELESIDDPISDDEKLVAIKCGPVDYHFISCINGKWFNKSGITTGVFIDQSLVTNKVWYPIWEEDGFVYTTDKLYYDDETIYFAIKKGWDKH